VKLQIQRQPRRTPEQIRELLERYHQSGLSRAQFVAAEGICLATLARYLKTQAAAAAGQASFGPARLIEIEDGAAALLSGGLQSRRDFYRVCFREGTQLEIPAGFAPGEVAGLLTLISTAVGAR
jgi:hypothetical protein